MESITKNKVSKEQIEQMVKKAFGSDMKISDCQELPEGFCNAAYRLVLADGRGVILKVAPRKEIRLMSHESELMKTEVGAMQMAAQHQIQGVAKIYYYEEDSEICGSSFFLMEELDGCGYHIAKQNMSSEKQEEMEYSIGCYLRNINQIKGEKFGHFCEKDLQFDDWFTAFYCMMERVIADGVSVNIDIGTDYDVILKRLREDKVHFLEITEPRLVHMDSWAGNIFVKDDRVVGLIDWERALWGDGLMEECFRSYNVNPSLKRGYGLPELTKDQQIRSHWYDVYLYLIMMFEVTFRKYPTDDQYRWVHGLFEQVWEKLK